MNYILVKKSELRVLDQNFCFYLSFIIAASKTLRFSLFSEIATVTTAYNAVTTDQLSLSPGQLILVKRKHPDGWWEGELQVMSWRLSIRGCICQLKRTGAGSKKRYQ